MVNCSQDQYLKKALQREKDPVVRQRIQMILLGRSPRLLS
jgi:hypothetical protein